VEEMKYYTFYRESNKFDDILADANIKKFIREKIRWLNYLKIGIDEYEKGTDKVFFYITLKYGDEIRTQLTKDYRPIPNVDYIPIRK
jgi:hypothetical protein